MPPEFGDAAFLLKTGWTWQEYMDAPDDLVTQMIYLMNAEAEVSKAQIEEAKAKR